MKTRLYGMPAVVLAMVALAESAGSVAAPYTGGALVERNQSTEKRESPAAEQPFSLVGGRSGISRPRNVVIRDSKSFSEVWAEHAKTFDGSVPPAPKIDFKKYDVVAVFLGAIPTGGHSIEIGEVKRIGRKAVVSATHVRPPQGGMVTQAFTTPFAMKAVPKLPATVTFDIADKARGAN